MNKHQRLAELAEIARLVSQDPTPSAELAIISEALELFGDEPPPEWMRSTRSRVRRTTPKRSRGEHFS